MAQAFLVAACSRRSVPVAVSSAGFLFDDHPASDTTVKVLHERGIDLRAHRSRIVSAELFSEVDLVLTMERRHARDLVLSYGRAEIVYTLKGFATTVSALLGFGPDNDALQITGVSALVHAVDVARSPDGLLGDGRPDEVADPHGHSVRAHRKAADEIATAVEAIAAAFAAVEERRIA